MIAAAVKPEEVSVKLDLPIVFEIAKPETPIVAKFISVDESIFNNKKC